MYLNLDLGEIFSYHQNYVIKFNIYNNESLILFMGWDKQADVSKTNTIQIICTKIMFFTIRCINNDWLLWFNFILIYKSLYYFIYTIINIFVKYIFCMYCKTIYLCCSVYDFIEVK